MWTKRHSQNAEIFLRDLRQRVPGHFQLTTDGFGAYKVCVPRSIGKQVDFAQLIKVYANPEDTQNGERRYSPSQCVATRTVIRRGDPSLALISTSYIERTNLSVRLFNRRFTRLTLGYSKKFEYLTHSIALFIAHFNFVRKHAAHTQTPAQAAGLTDHAFTLEEILLGDFVNN